MDMHELNYELNIQKSNLRLLQECLKHINFSLQNSDSLSDSSFITDLLTDVKFNLDSIKNNISNLEVLKRHLKNFSTSSDENPQDESVFDNLAKKSQLMTYENMSKKFKESIQNTNISLNKFLLRYVNGSTFILDYIPKKDIALSDSNVQELESLDLDEVINVDINNSDNTSDTRNSEKTEKNSIKDNSTVPSKNIIEDIVKEREIKIEKTNKEIKKENNDNNTSNNNYSDKKISKVEKKLNKKPIPVLEQKEEIIDRMTGKTFHSSKVLLISEKQRKVFLPYDINEVNYFLEYSTSCKTLQDVIDKRYTLPLDRYKNPVLSRFKETYNLMKRKQKASVADSLDLALELAFNFNLNPAIITACKNLEELDSYLSCLELDELSKFDYFEVKYEVSPLKK